MKTAFTVLAFSGLLASALSAAEVPESKGASSVSESPGPGGPDLRSLLRDVGGRLHKRFIWDPRLTQMVDLGSLQRQELTYPQLLAILQINGLVAVEHDGLVEVLPNVDARQAPTPVVSADNIKGLDDELLTAIVTLKNVSAAQLVPLLRPYLPQYAHLAAFPDRNALIVTDRIVNVRRVIEMAKHLDRLPKAEGTTN